MEAWCYSVSLLTRVREWSRFQAWNRRAVEMSAGLREFMKGGAANYLSALTMAVGLTVHWMLFF